MKKGTTDITINEWLQELEAINADPGEGYTTGELSELWGISEQRTRNRLKLAKKEGCLKVTRIKRETLSGIMQTFPGYLLSRPE